MPLFLIVSEIYWCKVSKWWKLRNFFELFGPPCRIALADLDDSIPECAQVCALHIEPHLKALRKIEMIAVHCTNETTPIFWVFNSPPPALQGPMNPRGGRGTSADIVPTQIKFGVDPIWWDIAQKPPKCKNSPLISILTKISFPPPRGPLTPKRGEDTSGTRVRPHANFGVNRPAGCREIVDRTEKKQKTKQKTYSKNISRALRSNEWIIIIIRIA